MEYITIREAVRLCNVTERDLRNAVRSGELPHILRSDRSQRHGSWGSRRPVKHVSIAELEAWAQRTGCLRKKA